MYFWFMVAVAYAIIIVVGLSIGLALAGKFPGDKRGGTAVAPVPAPAGPSFGLDVAPLGSDFDRALLPDAFPTIDAPV